MTRRHLLAALILASLAYPAARAAADVVTYTVDPTQSSLTISGTYEGELINHQVNVPDGLTVTYGGAIIANRDFSGNTLHITGGTVDAQINSPFISANYAFIKPALSETDQVFEGTVDNFAFSISSQPVDAPETFDISSLSISIISGVVNYFQHENGLRSGEGGTLTMAGALTLVSAAATLTDAQGIETLNLPFQTSAPITFTTSDGVLFPLEFNFSGTIVATTPVPEPASLTILLVPAFLFLRRGGINGKLAFDRSSSDGDR